MINWTTCAKFADSDHPAHAKITLRAFALHLYTLQFPMSLFADSEGLDLSEL